MNSSVCLCICALPSECLHVNEVHDERWCFFWFDVCVCRAVSCLVLCHNKNIRLETLVQSAITCMCAMITFRYSTAKPIYCKWHANGSHSHTHIAHAVAKENMGQNIALRAKDKEWMTAEERVKRWNFNIDSAKRCNRLNNDVKLKEESCEQLSVANTQNTLQCAFCVLWASKKSFTKFTLIFQLISIITKQQRPHNRPPLHGTHKHLSISTMTTSMSKK